jgi:type II secretory pathway component PulL
MGEPAREWWHRVAAINHLKLSGYNLFIVYETGKDPSCLDALAMPS